MPIDLVLNVQFFFARDAWDAADAYYEVTGETPFVYKALEDLTDGSGRQYKSGLFYLTVEEINDAYPFSEYVPRYA